MITGITARVGLAALAVVAVAWLAYDLRALSLDAQGRAQARVARSTPQVERALSLFADAARGNADPTPRIDEARFLLSLGRTRQAVGVLDTVVHTNPGNVLAWSLLASSTAASDPRRAAEAVRQLRLQFGHPFVYYVAQRTIFSPTGVIQVVPGQVIGGVDTERVIGRVARFVGWSATLTKKPGGGVNVVPSADILILADGRFVAGGAPTMARPDLERSLSRFVHASVTGVGFTIDAPLALLYARGRKARIQVFGSAGGVASLLPIKCSPQPQVFGCGQ
jgi:hypothetical protein